MLKVFVFIFISLFFNSCSSTINKDIPITPLIKPTLPVVVMEKLPLKDYIKLSLRNNSISSIEAILDKNIIPQIGVRGDVQEIIYLKNLKSIVVYRGYLKKERILSGIKFIYLNGEIKTIGKIKNLTRKTTLVYKIKDKKIINYQSSFSGEHLEYLFFDIKEDMKYTDIFEISKKEKIDYFHISAGNVIYSIQAIYKNKQEKSALIGKENQGKYYKIYAKAIQRIEVVKGYFNNQIIIASMVFQYKNGRSVRVGNMQGVKFLNSKMQLINNRKIKGYKVLQEEGYIRSVYFLK